MKRSLLLLALAGCGAKSTHATGPTAATPSESWTPAEVARYVNPLIGTKGGETWPGADTPFGMVQFSPENTKGNPTRTARPGGYGYDFTRIRGFALTHMSGTGCAGAYGDVPLFPLVGEVTSSPSDDKNDATYASNFSHEHEKAEAGYYQVTLDSGVKVELTATTRTGAARFTYPAGSPATLLVRTSSSEVGSENATTTIDPATRTISGSVTSGNFCGYLDVETRHSYYTLYFHAEVDQPFVTTGTWRDTTVTPASTSAQGGTGYGDKGWPPLGKGSGAYVTFARDGKPIHVRVGISFVSLANAKANLHAENPSFAFEANRKAAFAAWNRQLARVEIEGGSDEQKTTFYTALYHALLHPNVFNDVNGEYLGMDQKVHKLASTQQVQYANFSGWDVYRGQLQLLAFLEPRIAGEVAQSLLNQADQYGGVWDRWTHGPGATHVMTGDPGHIAVASIWAFGGQNFDAKRALASMVHAATVPTDADLSKKGAPVMSVGERPSLDKYLTLHYVPADGNAWGGVGETLEDVSADFAVAQLAARLGERGLHEQFLARSGYWRNVFNPKATPTAGYMQDRKSDGTWVFPFNPGNEGDDDTGGFAEGSSAQYTWMIPFDPHGLFEAMGGQSKAVERLDAFFRKPDGSWALTKSGGLHAEMDNEPSIGAAYLYSFAGVPQKTQATVRQVIQTLWGNRPDGIPGQDDLGAMSAWFVWSSLGLYPNYPGRAELLLTAPVFPRVVIRRANGTTVTIEAPAAAPNAAYINGVSLEGKPVTRSWLPESFVASGGTLGFTLSDQPGSSWATAPAELPPSFN
jgi:predicted alpha-1,2-mannosidase